MDRKSPMKLFGTEVGYMLTENARKMLREAAEKETRRLETMYESPIEIIYQEMQTQIDGDIFRAVQSYNINVDRDELIKALNYDRDQYQKGFEDGKKAGPDWIPVSERLPEESGFYIVTIADKYTTYTNSLFFMKSTPDMWEHDKRVIAWMPLPAPYTPDHQEESDGE